MRYLTILLAIGFGMMLCWIMLLNPQEVPVYLEPEGMGFFDQPVRQMAVWSVIFWSVAAGIAIGFLMTWSGGAGHRRRLRDMEYDKEIAAQQDDEPDYVVGLTNRRR